MGRPDPYGLYQQAFTPWEWHEAIFARARERGILPFSSPFDPTAVALLRGPRCAGHKTASAEIVDLPLIREIGRTGKPIFMSTGMATLAEIDAALTAARDGGAAEVILLACTRPTRPRPARPACSPSPPLEAAFGVPVGLSRTTPRGSGSRLRPSPRAVAVEKHVTLDRADGGWTRPSPLEPDELAALVRERRRVARGRSPRFGPTADEQAVLRLRRSLYVVADVAAGDEVTTENVRSIRPPGPAPDALATVLGRRFTRAATRGTAFTWDLVQRPCPGQPRAKATSRAKPSASAGRSGR